MSESPATQARTDRAERVAPCLDREALGQRADGGAEHGEQSDEQVVGINHGGGARAVELRPSSNLQHGRATSGISAGAITVRISLAWWLPLYLGSVMLFARLAGMEPDPVKVAHWVRRACRVQMVRS